MYKASYDNGSGEQFFYDDIYPLNEYRIIDPTVRLVDSAAAEFSVTIPPTNVAYDILDKMSTEICVYDGDEEIFDGRIVSDDRDFYNNRAIQCEGGLAYLVDTTQPTFEYKDITLRQFVEGVISIHNQKVEEKRQFTVDYVSPNLLANNTGDIYISYRATQYESTLEVLNKVCQDYGGHLKYWREVVDGKKVRKISIIADEDFEIPSGKAINFGENLLEFTQGFDMSNLCTVLVATGERETSPDQSYAGDKLVYFGNSLPAPTNITRAAYNALSDDDRAVGYYVITDEHIMPTNTFYPADANSPKRIYKGLQISIARAALATRAVDVGGVKTPTVISSGVSAYYLSEPIEVEAGKSYFVTGRLSTTAENVYYVIIRSDGSTILEFKSVSKSNEQGVEDITAQEVVIPEGGKYMYVCGFQRDLPVQLQKAKTSLEKVDTYMTLVGATGANIIPSDHTLTTVTRAEYDALSDADKDDESKWYYVRTDDQLIRARNLYKDKQYLINPEMVEKYGWIEKTAGWNDISDKEELMLYGFTYLFGGQWDEVNISLTAFDMHMLNASVPPYRLYQKAWVFSEPHGLYTEYTEYGLQTRGPRDFPITELEIPLLNPESTQFSLGYKTEQTFTEATASANVDILNQILGQPTYSETLQSAFENAAAAIAKAMSGVITVIQNENGAQEMLIHDGANGNYHLARHLWRININGFGYGEDTGQTITPDRAYSLANSNIAITADGQIVANFITAGEMMADRVRGGELILGSYDSTGSGSPPGKLTVYNSDGYYLFKVGDESNPTVSARGVSAQSQPINYGGVTVRDIIQMHKGHLYWYMTEKTGSYQQEEEHVNAIANIFMSRDSQWSSAEGCALIFFAPNFHFMKDPHSAGTATTKFDTNVDIVGNTSINGNITIKGSATVSSTTSWKSLYNQKIKYDQGLIIDIANDENAPNYWTNGSNEINIGGTTLNKSDLDALLALIHPQQNPDPDQNGGA